ncbi:MAG TPA: hypothetical protein V6C65_32500 [Allocoleopsis sp.]
MSILIGDDYDRSTQFIKISKESIAKSLFGLLTVIKISAIELEKSLFALGIS